MRGPNRRSENLTAVEARLKESEQRYHALTRNIPLGIYRRTVGMEGKLIMVNPALVRMFGYDNEKELNQVPVARLYFNPAECEQFSDKLFEHGEVIKEQIKMRRRDGTPVWVAVTATVICGTDDTPYYFDGIMEDITAAKEAEEQRRLQQQQLMQADRMISLGVLVSGVAHEINNPTQFIVSHVDPLKKIWSDALPILDRYYKENGDFLLGGQRFSRRKEQVPSMFKNIEEGTMRIKHIVDELRNYAREQPAKLKQEVNLNDVVKSSLALLKSLIKKTTGQFYATYANNMPAFSGDYQRIEQVVINLVQNSCQALNKDGNISIITSYVSEYKEVMLQVSDTGCGISKKNIKHITDPFFTTKRNDGGTGLGLSISETIIKEHHGRLEFDSEEGIGTTARLFLPAIVQEGHLE